MIRSIEGIRGIAALLVALYHLQIGSSYFSIIRNGYLFVDLFFVLSGFVICSTYANSLQGMGEIRYFLIRRFGRLFPLLAFSTIAFVLASNAIVFAKKVAIASGQAAFLNNPDALAYLVPDGAEIVSTLTLTHSLGIFDHLILNTPTWSISTEFYTYVLFAVICMVFSGGARIAILAILAIASLIVSVWASVNIHNCLQEKGCLSLTYDFGYVRCVHSFCLGALAYYSSRLLRVNATAVQLTILFTLFMLLALVDYVPIAAFAFPVAFAGAVLGLAGDSGPLADALKPKLFQALGQRSYSIYLLHMPLLLVFENIAKRANGIVMNTVILAIYIVVLYVISGWTYRLIEDPARGWFNRLAAGIRPQGAASET